MPPVVPTDDDPNRLCPELKTVIPRRRQRAYDVRSLIHRLVDLNSFFESGRYWGRTVVVGLARLDGRPVGVFADDPEVNPGEMDSPCCQKLRKHLKMCDVMGLPLLQLVDIPGFAIGRKAESTGVMKWAMELCKASFWGPESPSRVNRADTPGPGLFSDHHPHLHRHHPTMLWDRRRDPRRQPNPQFARRLAQRELGEFASGRRDRRHVFSPSVVGEK